MYAEQFKWQVRAGLGLDRELAPQKLPFLWQLYIGGRRGREG